MRVVIFGATGRAGSRILQELLRRRHQIIAVARDAQPSRPPDGVEWKVDDLSTVQHIVETIRGADAVVSAYAPPGTSTDDLVGVCQRLAKAVDLSGVPRMLVVGGAGPLKVAPGITLIQSGKLPQEWVPIAVSHQKALLALQGTSVDWTYISPGAFFEPGERTGRYRTSKDTLITNEQGDSRISMEDYAIALVDELEAPNHRRDSFAVGW